MRIAVAGGTGVVGTHVVRALAAGGHHGVVLARGTGVDLFSGAGLDAALDGVQAVIDVANVTTVRRRRAVAWFEASTSNLLRAAERAGVQHLVALSIVGVDRADLGYYAGKRRQEELLLTGDRAVGTSVLRATQFHEFAGQLLARAPGPLAVVPAMLSQPVAAREVAAALVELAGRPPVGMAPELAGPQPEQVVDLARRYLAAVGARRRVLPVRLPGRAGRELAGGALLPTAAGPRGRQTFEQWLAGPDGPRRS